MANIDRKIYAYDFTGKRNLLKCLNDYCDKHNNDNTKLKERGLIYTPENDNKSYFLELTKQPIQTKNPNDTSKLTTCFKGIIHQIRTTDLPALLNIITGSKSGLTLKNDETLVEMTHFVAFPEINLILSEYNYFGARVEKIKIIIDTILNIDTIDLDIKPLLLVDNSALLDSIVTLKEIELKAGHTGYKSLNEVFNFNFFDDVSNEFDNLSDFEIDVKITAKRCKDLQMKDTTSFIERLSTFLKKKPLSVNQEKENIDDIKKLRFKLYDSDDKLVPIDLLEEKLVHTMSVTKLDDRHKYIDSEDMFYKILTVYNNNFLKIDRYIPIKNI